MERIQELLAKLPSSNIYSAAILTIGIFFGLLTVRKIFQLRLEKRSKAEKATLFEVFILGLMKSTRILFILSVALYFGSHSLELDDKKQKILERVIVLLALFQCGSWGSLGLNFWINTHLKKRAETDAESATTLGLISFLSKALLFALIALLALNSLGVDITALIAGLGVGGIAIALALQNILADLFASLTIVLDKPFIVGDFIVVGDLKGNVEHIGLKTTRLRSISGEQLIFSNGDLLQSRIQNFKRMNERRVVMKLGVTYQTTSDQLKMIPPLIEKMIADLSGTRFDRCHFLTFGDSSLDFELVYWILNPDFLQYANLAQSVNLKIFEEFNRLGISFAYPTRTLFTVSEPQPRA
jgi:small-conductance mechanosensitive channel